MLACAGASANASTLQPSFNETTAFSGLDQPTSVVFLPNGNIVIAEKSGIIKLFQDLSDNNPTVMADLRTEVYNFWDRGLVGLTADPQYPIRPYLYVAYAYDALPGGSAPHWGQPGVSNDPCPTPPGPTDEGCVITGRVSRLTVTQGTVTAETPLVTDWCQQFPSHSIDDVAFGGDGALYVSGGEGANFNAIDWGQFGGNPCGDPGEVGGVMSPPTAEGGSLRAQDVRTLADPTGLDGSVIRIDPDTGLGLPDNPYAGTGDANAERIVGYGLRNPFRLAARPGTDEIWVANVGQNKWEEIEQLKDPSDSTADNFGWPCYEGGSGVSLPLSTWDSANLSLCESLYTENNAIPSHFGYQHAEKVVPEEGCPSGGSSISGLSFYGSGSFPASFEGALFFADYARDCIWVMKAGTNGEPDPTKIQTFVADAANPVDLAIARGGSLFYIDYTEGTLRRVDHIEGNTPPNAVATATPSSGAAPLTVALSGAKSDDPDNDPLTFAWDLDEDGEYDDASGETVQKVFENAGTYTVKLKVTDSGALSDVASISIQAGNTVPEASIMLPSSTTTWDVDDLIEFAGSGNDTQDGPLPPAAFEWNLILNHCPSTCHEHTIQTYEEVDSGDFTTPDHEYPSHLTLRLKVTDSGGLSATDEVSLQPNVAQVGLETAPAGLTVGLNDSEGPAPLTTTVIRGSENTVTAAPQQTLAGTDYYFLSWSDGLGAAHQVKADQNRALTATYASQPSPPLLTAVTPGGPANQNHPLIRGTTKGAGLGSVLLYNNGDCSGAPSVSGSPGAFAQDGLAAAVGDDSLTAFSARVTSVVAPTSGCSNSIGYREDSTAPETTITSRNAPKLIAWVKRRGPRHKSLVKLPKASFDFSSSDLAGARFECRFDRSDFMPCASRVTYPKLRKGRHEFAVRAVDAAGNLDASPATSIFSVVKRASPRSSRRSR